MKSTFYIFILALISFGCGDEVEFNNPAFQGDRANILWRASSFSARIEANGFLTITGSNGVETVNLLAPTVIVTPESNPFIFGDVDTIEAQFVDAFGTVFSTNNRPDESVSIYPELGEFWIDDIDIASNTLSGRFRFLAFNANGESPVGYTNGIYFRVPITSGTIPGNPTTCEDVTAAADQAEAAYNAAISNDNGFYDVTTYETACNAYKDALIQKQNYCGDVDDAIQNILDNVLGDCIYTCEFAEANVAEALSQFNGATLGNYIENCNQYIQYLQEQITYCGDDDGSIQEIIDGLNCNDDDNDGVANLLEDLNNDGDLTNDDSDGDLNANYLDDDDDDDGIVTSDELNFDADGNPADTDADGIPDYLDNDDDNDGINSSDEDINNDGNLNNDDTDGDGIPNYLDSDDDGDSIFTIFEGALTQDSDGDGIPDYLDEDDDDDSILTIFENPDPNGDGNPSDADNFDGDTQPNYLDNDDDNDGVLTIDENPDPNGDGNPDDAQNSDADSSPDYLDA